ncbi:hypothetical protein VOM14_18650 [Paraburkholderia sp. MPAMCS5]|uniref:hypothetical protein n=1 Tax=Paraburkholderia sp. MPAMCS5 TaxID=3112563 RepID=UPI002E1735A8|nr:hypothetical protein [Paraburkholderia sp. MPAMCS5]
MTSAQRANYSGLLLRLKTEEAFPAVASRLPDVEYHGAIASHGWHLFNWTTDFDAGVEHRDQADDGRFIYPLLLRDVEERFLLASIHSDIVQQFLGRMRLTKNVERPLIDVAGLVKDSVFPDGDPSVATTTYRMGSLYASVDGYGRSVRTLSLFGDDLGSAGLVRDILKHLNPYRVTLREVRSEQEVLSLSTQGEISFYYRGATSLEAVDKALSHVRRGNFIHWRVKP